MKVACWTLPEKEQIKRAILGTKTEPQGGYKLPKKLDKGLIAFLEKLKGAFAWSLKGTLKEYEGSTFRVCNTQD